MGSKRFLAFDLGAESGRAFTGTLADGRLSLEEIYRFPNEPVEMNGTLYWDILALYQQVLKGMREYTRRYGAAVDGIGIDTWGVDFGLLARDGSLLQNPVHHRDHRTDGMLDALVRRVPAEDAFACTGVSPAVVTSSCQLFAMRMLDSPVLDAASRLLMLPDLLAYFLTGHACCERSNAISTQLYDPQHGEWSAEMLRRLGLPLALMPPLIDPGSVVGELREEVKQQTGLLQGTVIAPCTHDTPSAIAATPGSGEEWAFISCGTWSVLGALTTTALTSTQVLHGGFANGITLQSSYLYRNIIGLWLLQQARAAWERQGMAYTYNELIALAAASPTDGPLLDPTDSAFLAPRDMLQAIRTFCLHSGQHPPEEVGEVVRCILESLALSYRQGIEQLAQMLARRFTVIHLVGGGARNALLCQLTADATGLPVFAGPVEATVAGNLLTQAYATGDLSSAAAIRQTVRRSSEIIEYTPENTAHEEARYTAYQELFAHRVG